MSKNETNVFHLIGLLFLLTPLYGEMKIAILTSVKNNSRLELLDRNVPVQCEPFGIITLETMSQNGASPEECRNRIQAFYTAYPHYRHFACEHLYPQQSYHYEKIDTKCIVYAHSQETYSEMLLNEGLAIVDPNFEQKEWNVRLKRAEKGAQRRKQGLYDSEIPLYCIQKEK